MKTAATMKYLSGYFKRKSIQSACLTLFSDLKV